MKRPRISRTCLRNPRAFSASSVWIPGVRGSSKRLSGPRLVVGGDAQNRTGDGGFADLCLTTWLRRRPMTRRSILPVRLPVAKLVPGVPNPRFLDAMAHLPAGVVVVSARVGDEFRGLTASSFVSISVEPPLVAVALEHLSVTRAAVLETKAFNVSVLTRPQEFIADR